MEVKAKNTGSRRKVIYFITKSVWGGAAKYVMDLASGLDADKWQVFVAAGGEGLLKMRALGQEISWISVPHFGRNIKIIADIISFFEVSRILRREEPDVIHVNSSKAGGICGLAGYVYNITARKKVKMIFTVHGWPFMEDRPSRQNVLIKVFTKLTCIFYDAVIVISKSDFDTAKTFRRINFIHNGIDAAEIKFLAKAEAREKLNLSEDALVIGTIGEWTRNKGWDILIDAFSLFASSPLTLVMIGSGENPDEARLHEYIQKKNLAGKVIAIEYIKDAASYLKAFDIFVFPSRKEGLSYALLEAGLAGLPIVASAVGGNLDIIEDGKTGIFVPKNDAVKLREEIIKLIQNQELQKTLGENAKEKVEKEFSLSKMREKTYALY